VVVTQFAGKMALQQMSDPGLVVGVGKLLPGCDSRRRQLGQGIANKFRLSLVELCASGLNVPLPGANIGGFDDTLQTPVFVAQFFIRLPPTNEFAQR
jgi:hypothetical protein